MGLHIQSVAVNQMCAQCGAERETQGSADDVKKLEAVNAIC